MIEELPDGDSACHGDPNGGNFMCHGDKIRLIDWVDCVKGNPLYDITEYILMNEYPAIPTDLPDGIISFLTANFMKFTNVFLAEYGRLSGVDLSGVSAWRIPLLVAKMGGNNSEEKQAQLLEGIRKELRGI